MGAEPTAAARYSGYYPRLSRTRADAGGWCDSRSLRARSRLDLEAMKCRTVLGEEGGAVDGVDVNHLERLVLENARKTKAIYSSTTDSSSGRKRLKLDPTFASNDPDVSQKSLSLRLHTEYSDIQTLPEAIASKLPTAGTRKKKARAAPAEEALSQSEEQTRKLIEGIPSRPNAGPGGANSSALLIRVISGYLGWVRALAVEPDNKWFASGAGDRTIKIWDLATGNLKLTLTGHISTVRGLAISPRHPYIFSYAEDKMVKCWDLETNKVIRHYHSHLSGVYALALHPTLDVLVTGGRDGTIADLVCQEGDPQVITGSLDSTVRMWDLAAGKTIGVLTHHKKGKYPEGAFIQNFKGHNAIINTLSKSGHRFQGLDTTAQPGSLDAESGIISSVFNRSGSRLICSKADKTNKDATPESHPLEWKPTLARRKF
ncbi:WD40-repeat-containing domain protein [Lasiosphaeria hispida]|uniref:Pre-mRNA-splicing factor PRP46 n=1 Tax=Lasiosphaeria hispida TaxID=260671 RepID=A0AAJ0HWK0_9PEZI|nr:WD40-repeat-containing domain protein [Lasiosphaeria hispida]